MNVETRVYIWSFKHKMWWRANSHGYTPHAEEAGLYEPEEAGRIARNSVFMENIIVTPNMMQHEGPPTHHPYFGEPSEPDY